MKLLAEVARERQVILFTCRKPDGTEENEESEDKGDEKAEEKVKSEE